MVDDFPAIPAVAFFPTGSFCIVVSQSVGGGTVGEEDLCGLNSNLLPSLPPLLRAVAEQVPPPQTQTQS